jgi:glycine/D-amino acid oxidase-like deaminating enzyme
VPVPRLRLGRSLWLARASDTRATSYAPLRGDVAVDVVIVGGGITGAALAWRFADAGVRVVLVEAKRVGGGSTAASTALLMQEPDEDLTHLARRYGAARARRVWELSRAATRSFVETIRRLRIRGELRQCDSVYYTLTPDDGSALRREYEMRKAAGLGGRWLPEAAVRRLVGLDNSVAIRTAGNAQADPYQACRGFIRAAISRGARVHEASPVDRIDASSRNVTVVTAHGRITADRVVIATGYTTPFCETLAARFRLLDTYVLATRPIATRKRRALGLAHVMLWDTGRPYHYARWTNDHRLLLGGGDRPHRTGKARERAMAEGLRDVRNYFVARYPALEEIAIEYEWEGLFATTPDGLPYIGPHRHYPRHLFALGYGGNGMTLGFLAGRLLLEWYQGKRTSDHDLFAFGRL